jgi:hypothetical protein
MTMACSSEFHLHSLTYLSSKVDRLAVFSDVQPTMDTTGNWSNRICGTTSPTVSAPGSTTNGWTVKVSSADSLSVNSSGKAGHVTLWTSGSIRYVTTCTTRNIQGTDTVSIPAWNVRVADPTSS